MNEKRNISIYLAAELILLIAIEAIIAARPTETYLTGPFQPLNILMYLAIILNTIMALWYFTHDRKKEHDMLAYGLFATCAADFFMTLLDTDAGYIIGVILFCIVETIYLVYLKPTKTNIILRALLYIAALISIYMAGLFTTANALGILNIVLVVTNVPSAFLTKRAHPPLLFKIGITLFMSCDLSIMIRTLTTGTAHDIVALLVWLFYIPAQVLITMAYIKPLK